MKLQASFTYASDDDAAFALMPEALRQNLADALASALDKASIGPHGRWSVGHPERAMIRDIPLLDSYWSAIGTAQTDAIRRMTPVVTWWPSTRSCAPWAREELATLVAETGSTATATQSGASYTYEVKAIRGEDRSNGVVAATTESEAPEAPDTRENLSPSSLTFEIQEDGRGADLGHPGK